MYFKRNELNSDECMTIKIVSAKTIFHSDVIVKSISFKLCKVYCVFCFRNALDVGSD